MAADTGQAPGDAGGDPGVGVGLQSLVVVVEFGGGRRPVEPHRVGIDALVGQDVAFPPPVGAQRIEGADRGLFVVRVGLGCHGHSISSGIPVVWSRDTGNALTS